MPRTSHRAGPAELPQVPTIQPLLTKWSQSFWLRRASSLGVRAACASAALSGPPSLAHAARSSSRLHSTYCDGARPRDRHAADSDGASSVCGGTPPGLAGGTLAARAAWRASLAALGTGRGAKKPPAGGGGGWGPAPGPPPMSLPSPVLTAWCEPAAAAPPEREDGPEGLPCPLSSSSCVWRKRASASGRLLIPAWTHARRCCALRRSVVSRSADLIRASWLSGVVCASSWAREDRGGGAGHTHTHARRRGCGWRGGEGERER